LFEKFTGKAKTPHVAVTVTKKPPLSTQAINSPQPRPIVSPSHEATPILQSKPNTTRTSTSITSTEIRGDLANLNILAQKKSFFGTRTGRANLGNGDNVDFKVTNVLGQGGFGAVYAVKITGGKEAKEYAMKVFNTKSAFDDAQKNIADLQSVVQGHPNFLQQHGVGRNLKGGELDVIYSEMGGRNLKDTFIPDPMGTTLGSSRMTKIDAIDGIIDGMTHFHSGGYTHWDFKPENVLVGLDGKAKIIDLDTATTAHTSDIGTQAYMAPERFVTGGTEKVPQKSDVYSVGITNLQLYLKQDIDDIFGTTMGASMFEVKTIEGVKRQVLTDAALESIQKGVFQKNLRDQITKEKRFSQQDRDFLQEIVLPALDANPTTRISMEQMKIAFTKWKKNAGTQ
jgi:serine/threonine protein kinase